MTAAPHSRRRPRGLSADEAGLLSERALTELSALTDRITEQKAAVSEMRGPARSHAKRVLQRQQRWADAYLQRLNRLRAGGPSCRECGRRLSYARLCAQLLAVECGNCGPEVSPRHPSQPQGAVADAAGHPVDARADRGGPSAGGAQLREEP